MAYAKLGYPTEFANKIGHIKLIQDPLVQRLIEGFEDHRSTPDVDLPSVSGNVDLAIPSEITQVITVDGGHQVVPNTVRPERQIGFVQVALQMVKLETLEFLGAHPMADPRDIQKLLGRYTHHLLAALPVYGVHLPGQTLKKTIRECVHRFIANYELYPTLSFLVYRLWEPRASKLPSMDCCDCGKPFDLPRNELGFACPACGHNHWLADYLGLCQSDGDDRSTEETVSNFRSAMEALALFSLVVKFVNHETIMRKTLFLLDGPLLLRAQLSRLVEPIRDLLEHEKSRGSPIFLVGIEKNGALRNFADAYSTKLALPGDYFLPTTSFVVEEISGKAFDPTTYRNRVSYGAKVVARVGPHHVLAFNVPTGQHVLNPTASDVIGLVDTMRFLNRVRSYAYDNALIPIVLANTAASISNRPSAGLLAQFVDSLMNAESA